MAKSAYVVKEYSTISDGLLGEPHANGIEVDSKSFQDLVVFIEENEKNPDTSSAFSMFRSKGRRHIKVKNHVGVIETRTGCSLEILPKIYAANGHSTNEKIQKDQKILLQIEMLLKMVKFIMI